MKTLKFLCVLGSAVLFGIQAFAGLQLPYTNDVYTLHLWHLDDPNTQPVPQATDTVSTAAITLCLSGYPTGGPFTNVSLGAQSFAGLGTCLNISNYNGFATTNNAGASWSDTSLFNDINTGAFTFEAVVNFRNNPLSLPNNMEFVCGDDYPAAGGRGWQFRITTSGKLDFNFYPGGSGITDFQAAIPSTGLDAAVAGQWYHVAVTYTGNNPTNGDTAYQLKFYWTLLDVNRTNADLLWTTNTSNQYLSEGANEPMLGIGGSARTTHGPANWEGLIGLIDEVRISSVARASNEMAFVIGGANPPSFSQQPATNTLIGYGKTLSVPTVVLGTLPIIYQWQKYSGSSYTNVPGQTDNALVISNILFDSTGNYRLIATNVYGSATSVVAQVTVGAAFSETFASGVDANGVLITGGAGVADPHYTLLVSSDVNNLGPSPIVWADAYPVSPNGIFANYGPYSGWIGPVANGGTVQGTYEYQTQFLIDQGTTTTATLQGTVWANLLVTDVRINGASTGITSSGSPTTLSTFTITNGFVSGLNTLAFVTTNNATGVYNQTGFRVQYSGVSLALAAGKPVINNQPVNQTVHDGSVGGQSVATFSVVALGRPPLTYQWLANSNSVVVTDATNRTLVFINPTAGSQGMNFSVVVSNDSGSVTSRVAILTLTTNHPPVAPSYSYTIYSNTTLNVSLDMLYVNASDPDGDPMTISYDGTSTNGGSVSLSGITLTYTPVTDYVGADLFNYSMDDGITATTGPININVVPLQVPTSFTASLSGNNVVLSGGGGSGGGGFTVLSSTNIMLPLASWTVNQTGAFNGSGNFSITNAIAPGVPQSYFIIRVP